MTRLSLDPVFKDFLKSLNAHGVEYLVIGGYAVGYYGFPRPTGDFDVWVRSTKENAGKLVAAVREFGFDVPELSEELFLNSDNMVRMGYPPNRIEILLTISGVEFDKCYPNRLETEFDGVHVKLIGRADLLINKKASGRYKDLADLEEL